MIAAQNTQGFNHAMRREIFEQPKTLAETLAQFVTDDHFQVDTCAPARDWLRRSGRGIVIAASGSSRHAGQVAELLIEDHSGIAVDVEYASECIYRSERALKDAAVMVVSQSGETADTLAALRKANAASHPTLAITNVPASSMAREAGVSFPTAAGRELAIPATKSFTAQLLNLYLLSLLAGEQRGELSPDTLKSLLEELQTLPQQIAGQLERWETEVRAVADAWSDKKSFLFLGRGVHYPIAREGALKLKESSYLNAEGYPSGELKHGPNALVSDATPLVMISTVDQANPESVERYQRVLQLMRDMKQQGATLLALTNTGDTEAAAIADFAVGIAPASEALLAIGEVIPLQMFAYHMAVHNGIDVDHPRNLSKAVLAE